ncbi:MAG: hypothetical protein NTZ39_08470 [Methanoregula sp.]|nr:hypothetical protein [Methanoregula sp.]
MSENATLSKTPNNTPLTQVIRDELSSVQKSRVELMTPRGPRGIQLIVLFVCVLTNIAFFFARSDYIALFIAASFYLNMFYFITLLIPTNFKTSKLPSAYISRFRVWLQEIGVKSGTTQITRLFTNALFINSRTLSLGLGLIFSIDIVFAIIHHHRGLPLNTTIIVITQCAIIVIFYLLVWMMEPFSTSYVKKVEKVKRSLHQQKMPTGIITGIFIFGFLLAIFLFLTTMIYLPGVTLGAIIDQSQLDELGHLFSLLAILAISQYFIVRYIHGITSRVMAERLFDFKENSLSDLLPDQNPDSSRNSNSVENPLETSALLLESKIYIIRRNSLKGAFPVFVVDLDFSVILDNTTLTAIKGYIVERKE